MRAVFHRAELLGAVKRGENIAPHESPLDVLKGLLFELDAAGGILTMTATNLEVTLEQKLRCQVSEDDAFVLNAGLAVSMLERLAGDTVSGRELQSPLSSTRWRKWWRIMPECPHWSGISASCMTAGRTNTRRAGRLPGHGMTKEIPGRTGTDNPFHSPGGQAIVPERKFQ